MFLGAEVACVLEKRLETDFVNVRRAYRVCVIRPAVVGRIVQTVSAHDDVVVQIASFRRFRQAEEFAVLFGEFPQDRLLRIVHVVLRRIDEEGAGSVISVPSRDQGVQFRECLRNRRAVVERKIVGHAVVVDNLCLAVCVGYGRCLPVVVVRKFRRRGIDIQVGVVRFLKREFRQVQKLLHYLENFRSASVG